MDKKKIVRLFVDSFKTVFSYAENRNLQRIYKR